MRLSPKAACLVDRLVSRAGSDRAKELWAAAQNMQDLSPEAARVLLQLLSAEEAALRRQIESGALDEDREADAANDLGLVLAIESDLRQVA